MNENFTKNAAVHFIMRSVKVEKGKRKKRMGWNNADNLIP